MKKQSIFLILILLALFLNGCKYDFILPVEVPPVDNGGQPVSFATQIVPIFTEKCIECHKTQAPLMNADIAYNQLVPKYVNTSIPASSKIYSVPSSGAHYARTSAVQSALILKWITEGAKNN